MNPGKFANAFGQNLKIKEWRKTNWTSHIWVSEEHLIQKSNFMLRLIQAGLTIWSLKCINSNMILIKFTFPITSGECIVPKADISNKSSHWAKVWGNFSRNLTRRKTHRNNSNLHLPTLQHFSWSCQAFFRYLISTFHPYFQRPLQQHQTPVVRSQPSNAFFVRDLHNRSVGLSTLLHLNVSSKREECCLSGLLPHPGSPEERLALGRHQQWSTDLL